MGHCKFIDTMNCFLFTTIILSKGVYAQVLIGPSPANQAVIIGTDHTLMCRAGPDGEIGFVQWEEDLDPTVTLFVGDRKQTNDDFQPKYINFSLDPDNLYDLVISSIAVEDEGTYICRNTAYPDGAVSVTRSVEVRSSSLEMTQAGSGDTTLVTVIEGEPSDIVCTAVGARPAVTIDWYHMKVGGSETKITDGVSQVDTPNADNADTTDSVSTLNYTATEDYNGGELRCETTGQEVAESRQDKASLNVQFIPEAEVEFDGNDEITCKSTANPTVVESGYVIILNGTIQYPPTAPLSCADGICTLVVDITFPTDVRCNATNVVGTGSDYAEAIPGATPSSATTLRIVTSPTGGVGVNTAAIVLGVLLTIAIIVIILLAYFLIRFRNGTKTDSSMKQNSLEPASNAPQSYMELAPQTRQHESANQQTSATNPDTSQAYMDLNPQTRDDKTAYQELDKNAQPTQGAVNQVYEEIKDDKTTKQQDKEPQTYANVQPNKPKQARRK